MRWLPSLCGSICSPRKNFLTFLLLLPKILLLFQQNNISSAVDLSKKKSVLILFGRNLLYVLISSPKKKKSLLRVLSDPYLYGSTFLLLEFLFPLLMRVDGLFSMESMTADMECTTICVRGFLFCPPKGSLIQPQYFLIRCIFPDLKII